MPSNACRMHCIGLHAPVVVRYPTCYTWVDLTGLILHDVATIWRTAHGAHMLLRPLTDRGGLRVRSGGCNAGGEVASKCRVTPNLPGTEHAWRTVRSHRTDASRCRTWEVSTFFNRLGKEPVSRYVPIQRAFRRYSRLRTRCTLRGFATGTVEEHDDTPYRLLPRCLVPTVCIAPQRSGSNEFTEGSISPARVWKLMPRLIPVAVRCAVHEA
ncbi:hypothetical protein LXA43DRAFT_494173 [Ganoderma leucocontextum]|nr:hypothetical protein LXA43DRAFT_494173 [Ganoderma leucocontextum]